MKEAPSRRADRGDLVLGLEGHDAVVLVVASWCNSRGRRDRVRAEEDLQVRAAAAGDEPEAERLVAHDVAVRAGGQVPAPRGPRSALEHLVDVAGVEARRCSAFWFASTSSGRFANFSRATSASARAGGCTASTSAPACRSSCSAGLPSSTAESRRAPRLHALVDVDLDDAVAVERSVLERVRLAASPSSGRSCLKLPVLTMTIPPGLRSLMLTTSAAGFIATSTSGASPGVWMSDGAEVELEAGDSRARPGWRPDLGREVGQRREVVADQRGGVRELVAGDLHAVAGVPGEADHHRLLLLQGQLGAGILRLRHRCSQGQGWSPGSPGAVRSRRVRLPGGNKGRHGPREGRP